MEFCCAVEATPERDECTKLTGGIIQTHSHLRIVILVNWKTGDYTNIVKADSDSIRLSSGYLVHEIEHGFRPYTRCVHRYVGSAISESQKQGTRSQRANKAVLSRGCDPCRRLAFLTNGY